MKLFSSFSVFQEFLQPTRNDNRNSKKSSLRRFLAQNRRRRKRKKTASKKRTFIRAAPIPFFSRSRDVNTKATSSKMCHQRVVVVAVIVIVTTPWRRFRCCLWLLEAMLLEAGSSLIHVSYQNPNPHVTTMPFSIKLSYSYSYSYSFSIRHARIPLSINNTPVVDPSYWLTLSSIALPASITSV